MPSVSVNLSAQQLHAPTLVEDVRGVLQRHRIPARMLTLEVTESSAMADPELSVSVLRVLADMGVQISIDDFGTGYSSLLYLKRLPAVELKIDRGFIDGLVPGSDDAAIVASIIALGRTLDMSVVAEGVETREQQELLTQLGCHSLQGFYLGRPQPAGKLRIARHAVLADSQTPSGAGLSPT